MGLIQVTPATLRAKAEELRSLNTNLKAKVENMNEVEQALAGKWKGDARDAFHQVFNNDKAQFDNFSILIENYIVALENAATEYDNKEAMNQQIASTRTY